MPPPWSLHFNQISKNSLLESVRPLRIADNLAAPTVPPLAIHRVNSRLIRASAWVISWRPIGEPSR